MQYLDDLKKESEAKQDARFRKGSSRHRGVSWYTAGGKWRMQASLRGGRRFEKFFDNEDDAGERRPRGRAQGGQRLQLAVPTRRTPPTCCVQHGATTASKSSCTEGMPAAINAASLMHPAHRFSSCLQLTAPVPTCNPHPPACSAARTNFPLAGYASELAAREARVAAGEAPAPGVDGLWVCELQPPLPARLSSNQEGLHLHTSATSAYALLLGAPCPTALPAAAKPAASKARANRKRATAAAAGAPSGSGGAADDMADEADDEAEESSGGPHCLCTLLAGWRAALHVGQTGQHRHSAPCPLASRLCQQQRGGRVGL